MKLVLATKNKGKIRELKQLLVDLPIELFGLDEFDPTAEIEETGKTFAENARLKAVGYTQQVGMTMIADDSGLEVAALEGRPGIHSARYGGPTSNYAVKIAMLLKAIDSSNSDDRSARFVSNIAIAGKHGEVLFEAEGICNGTIAAAPRGMHGFGYDPIFIPNGYEQTFGELPDKVKLEISHRAVAISKIIRYLRDFA